VLLANPYSGRLEVETILHLLEARLLIEPYLARLAARRATDAELVELGRALERAGRLLEGHDEQLATLNTSFHKGVARLSGSTVLAQALDSILDVYSAEQMVILRLYDNRRRDHEQHLEIFEALRVRDGERGSQLMREHIDGIRTVLTERLEQSS
jgi:GntR family transcriptional repressor for pyruvate dehydrogenase complex